MGSAANKVNRLLTNGIAGLLGGPTSTVPEGYQPANQLLGANINWAAGGAPAAGTSGNSTSTVAGTLYWSQLINDANCQVTGIDILTGATGGTDLWIASIFDVNGKFLASSSLAGVTAGTANNHTTLPLTSVFNLIGPAVYFIALQSNGTTAKFQSYTVANSPFITGSVAGVFGTIPATITHGSVYNNNTGPILCTY